MVMLQLSDYPITHEVLQTHVEMTKIGHRNKFLMKLDQEASKLPHARSATAILDQTKRTEACQSCLLM
jgi:hypothetical protein